MTRPRQINCLLKAELMPSGPFPENRRLRGSAARGISFQRKVHKHLSEQFAGLGCLLDGPWIRYADFEGKHWCQPDSVLDAKDRVVVFESKLSLRRLTSALVQLDKLYRPALELIFHKPVVMCVAFHHWIVGADGDLNLIDGPEELLSVPVRRPGPYGWHFL